MRHDMEEAEINWSGLLADMWQKMHAVQPSRSIRLNTVGFRTRLFLNLDLPNAKK